MKDKRRLLIAIAVTAVLIVAISAFLLVRPILDGNGDGLLRGLKYTVESGMAVITEYNGKDAHVTIPAEIDGRPVGVIGLEAFMDNTNLVSVTLPDTLVYIGVSAFSGCKNLNEVTIPGSVELIGGNAFLNCASLLEIEIPYGVEAIGWSAFEGCINLKSVLLPDSVASIDEYVFRNCRSLTEITVPGSVKTVGAGLFYGCRKLVSARFNGDKPDLIDPIYKVFYDVDGAFRIYYPRGALNWSSTWDDYPTEKV